MTVWRWSSTMPSRNAEHSATDIAEISAIERSPWSRWVSVTARTSGRSRAPSQTGHGTSRM